MAPVSEGWKTKRPLNELVAHSLPRALWQQVAEDGLLIGPFGSREEQTMTIARKIRGEAFATRSIPCRFVPLVSD